MPSESDAELLWRALKRLPPRTEQLLFHRFVDRATDAECAAWYGISPSAWAVQLYRAAQLFADALKDPHGPPLLPRAEPDGDRERAASALLVEELARTGPDTSTGTAPPISGELEESLAALKRLRRHADEVRTLTAQRARAELDSPEYRRNEWLRRLALFALIAVALWLYFRSPHP